MIDLEIIKQAILLTQQGNYTEAEELYLNLLKEEPNNHLLLSTVGLFYVTKKDYVAASKYLRLACEINETFGTVSALGVAEFEQENYCESAEILQKAITLGENADVYNKLVISLFKIKDVENAIKYSAIMLKKYPDNPDSVANSVKSLTHSGKLLEAEAMCVNYLKTHNEAAILWLHLGFLKELIYSDDNQAFECFRIAYEAGRDEALYNMATSKQKLGDYILAEEYYNKMLEIFPESNDAKVGLGLCYLAQRKFNAGYELLYSRKSSFITVYTDNFYNINDKFDDAVVVICDQGYGDAIQFSRYLPILKQRVKKLFVAVKKPLRELFEINFRDISFITLDDIDRKMQLIRITDLAYILGLDFDEIPSSSGYLDVGADILTSEKIKVGFCWEAGSAGSRTMINRTINVKFFEPLLNQEKIQPYSFQVQDSLNGNEKYPQMINLAKGFNDFVDTAKALKSMDLLITVDTSVAHLAGALGVKTILLLPYASDWRWFDNDKSTEWYDSVRIIKQKNPIDWHNEISEILKEL